MRHHPVPPATTTAFPRPPIRATLLGLLALAAGQAHAATSTTVYEGHLNGQRIVLELPAQRDPAEARSARYHLRAEGIDRPLTMLGGHDELILRGTGNTPVFEGKLTAQGLRGTWRAGGDGHPVHLRPVTPGELAARRTALLPSAWFESLRERDPYLFLKLSRPLELLGTIRQGNVEYQRWREPLSGVVFPRVPGRDPLNAALQDWHLKSAHEALQCAASSGAGRRAWNQMVRVTHVTGELISVRSSTQLDCGDGRGTLTDARTYDVASGRDTDLIAELGDQAARAVSEELGAGVCRGRRIDHSALDGQLVASLHPHGVLLELRDPSAAPDCARSLAPVMLGWEKLRTRRDSTLTRAVTRP